MASSPAQRDAEKAAWHPNVYLGLETDGSVIIVAHRSEMGTGVRTALPMIVADEMEADWARVRVEQALGDEKYGSQDTDGSASVRDFYEPLRQAGATARLMLERAAAAKWGVDAGECKAENHRVLHRSTQRALGFGELAVLAAKEPLPHPDEVRLKSESEFRYIGKGVAGIDLHAICTGRAEYGFDVQVS